VIHGLSNSDDFDDLVPLKVIHVLQAFSSVIFLRTAVQQFTRFQLK